MSYTGISYVQNRKDEAISVLSNIYNYERLEDEVNYLTAVSEQEMQKRKNIRYMDVFRSTEIRTAFFVGAGLQVIETSLNFLFLNSTFS